MIYVELKVFSENSVFDAWIDESLTAGEVIEELSDYFEINIGSSFLVSIRKSTFLENGTKLFMQDIRGGDTLILIEENNTSK